MVEIYIHDSISQELIGKFCNGIEVDGINYVIIFVNPVYVNLNTELDDVLKAIDLSSITLFPRP
ncbi:MAG: hypothetical protein B6D58_01300 [candidate division Zixibacteria bacterium 4484_95]|nr:MAG: hypothetical protein B6D58_01300 [candidate division Zixibacteria bacterium 4484_95]